jgi:uncharacterized damage-inducible protein DinB
MFSGNHIHLMAEYNAWMNENLYAACHQLEDIALKAERGAFFGSIFGTLNHILWGDRVWMARFTGQESPNSAINEWLHQDLPSLHQARCELDQQILNWAKGLDAEALNAPFTFTSRLYGFTQTNPLWVYATHLFNHQTHHRGQACTLLTQLGVDVGRTDIPVMPLLME